jgi:hypothetical protein
MSTTVPGGQYLSADKKTWHDANGNVIAPPPAFRAAGAEEGTEPAPSEPLAAVAEAMPVAVADVAAKAPKPKGAR